MRMVVVLPAPFAPRKPKIAPAGMESESASTARERPYVFSSPCSSIMGAVIGIAHPEQRRRPLQTRLTAPASATTFASRLRRRPVNSSRCLVSFSPSFPSSSPSRRLSSPPIPLPKWPGFPSSPRWIWPRCRKRCAPRAGPPAAWPGISRCRALRRARHAGEGAGHPAKLGSHAPQRAPHRRSHRALRESRTGRVQQIFFRRRRRVRLAKATEKLSPDLQISRDEAKKYGPAKRRLSKSSGRRCSPPARPALPRAARHTSPRTTSPGRRSNPARSWRHC